VCGDVFRDSRHSGTMRVISRGMKPEQIIAVLLVLLSGVVGYLAAIRRDRLSKRRDLRTQYLLDAYRRLEAAGNRREPTREDERALESSVADIQLLGSSGQVHLARQFALEFAQAGHASLDPLLEALRSELRKDLSLPPLDEGITFLRIVRSSQGRQE
jgi:hypothetical protein